MEPLEIINQSVNLKNEKLDLLLKRDKARQSNVLKKKEDSSVQLAENEKLGVFQGTFAEKQKTIVNSIDSSVDVPKSDLPEHFNSISKEIVHLQKYVASSNIFLRNYDLQKCKDIIQDLSVKLKSLEDELMPKQKFSFKNKIKPKPVPKHVNGDHDEVDRASTYSVGESASGFFNKTKETLVMLAEELFKKDVTLESLDSCKIYLKGSPSTLHLNHLKNCQVFSGPVSTSIFAENCTNSTFVIACQQLRLHTSRNVDIYLHVSSRAIMEDCTEMALAPYNWNYRDIEKDFQEAMLDPAVNNWRCIDDFNWLNEKHSPNWREIDEADRVEAWAVV